LGYDFGLVVGKIGVKKNVSEKVDQDELREILITNVFLVLKRKLLHSVLYYYAY